MKHGLQEDLSNCFQHTNGNNEWLNGWGKRKWACGGGVYPIPHALRRALEPSTRVSGPRRVQKTFGIPRGGISVRLL
jgi:hypothetical protein